MARGSEFNFVAPFNSVYLLNASSIACNAPECQCREVAGENRISCVIRNAHVGFNYVLQAKDSRGRVFNTAWRITAAGTVEVRQPGPSWLPLVQIIGVVAVLAIGASYGYKTWKKGTPEYKYASIYRKGRQARETLRTATIELAHGKMRDQVYSPLRKKLENEVSEAKNSLSRLEASIGKQKAEGIRKAVDAEEKKA